MTYGPNPHATYPNEKIPSICFIKNTITRPTIIMWDYTYYSDAQNATNFQDHVTHQYDFYEISPDYVDQK